ncbi:hypothetical protein [Coleofasciculus sp. FACHB-SPT36]|nr:hypothetical protein [Coleofasciculus sp. FACHB-SPT36]
MQGTGARAIFTVPLGIAEELGVGSKAPSIPDLKVLPTCLSV